MSWIAGHPDRAALVEWLCSEVPRRGSEFYWRCFEAIKETGGLSERQEAALHKARAVALARKNRNNPMRTAAIGR